MGQPAYTANDEPEYTGVTPRKILDEVEFNSIIEWSIEKMSGIKDQLWKAEMKYANEDQKKVLDDVWYELDGLQYKLEMMNKG